MIILDSKYGEVKVYAETFEKEAIGQVTEFANSPLGESAHIRMMPDMHKGAGCTIGTTAYMNDKVCPNVCGVDLNCGVTYASFPIQWKENLEELDRVVHEKVPSGFNLFGYVSAPSWLQRSLESLVCWSELDTKTKDSAFRSAGTLGGGNHYWESYDNGGISVHSGSRNIGLKTALYYQKIASKQNPLGELSYLTGDEMKVYLHDVEILRSFSQYSRQMMILNVVQEFGLSEKDIIDSIDSVHNHIDSKDKIIRKGAISAKRGERLIIPLSMRDGLLICYGKGNEDWNYSAPHGAGRLYSRSRAKKEFTLEQFQESMKGIYTTTVDASTLDEAPFAYKDYKEIMSAIEPTVEIAERLIPIYNFKSSGD